MRTFYRVISLLTGLMFYRLTTEIIHTMGNNLLVWTLDDWIMAFGLSVITCAMFYMALSTDK